MKKRWEFLWINATDPFEDDRKWRSRCYSGRSIKEASRKMLRWVESQLFSISVDYEARDLLAKPTAPHDDQFPDLTDGVLKEYVN